MRSSTTTTRAASEGRRGASTTDGAKLMVTPPLPLPRLQSAAPLPVSKPPLAQPSLLSLLLLLLLLLLLPPPPLSSLLSTCDGDSVRIGISRSLLPLRCPRLSFGLTVPRLLLERTDLLLERTGWRKPWCCLSVSASLWFNAVAATADSLYSTKSASNASSTCASARMACRSRTVSASSSSSMDSAYSSTKLVMARPRSKGPTVTSMMVKQRPVRFLGTTSPKPTVVMVMTLK
mmetsp:Transcript_21019/g.41649  ORF Transcript_21019/g.41649 Transcript_21019/m.41649 type:complete len:233 (-) Transcript_21019:781-1479(-)